MSVDAGRLWVRPSSDLPPEARAIVQVHRDAIVAAVEEQGRQIRLAIAEIACLRSWSADDVADALDAATRCPDVADWLALRDLVRSSPAVSTNPKALSAPTNPSSDTQWELVELQPPAWLDDVPDGLRQSLSVLMEANHK